MRVLLFVLLAFAAGAEAQVDADTERFLKTFARTFDVPGDFSFTRHNENLLLRVYFEGDTVRGVNFSDAASPEYHKELADAIPSLDIRSLEENFKGKFKGGWSLLIPIFINNLNPIDQKVRDRFSPLINYSKFNQQVLSGNIHLASPFLITMGVVKQKEIGAQLP